MSAARSWLDTAGAAAQLCPGHGRTGVRDTVKGRQSERGSCEKESVHERKAAAGILLPEPVLVPTDLLPVVVQYLTVFNCME